MCAFDRHAARMFRMSMEKVIKEQSQLLIGALSCGTIVEGRMHSQ